MRSHKKSTKVTPISQGRQESTHSTWTRNKLQGWGNDGTGSVRSVSLVNNVNVPSYQSRV